MRKLLFVAIGTAMLICSQGAPAFACDCNKAGGQNSCQGADVCGEHQQQAVKGVEVGNRICPVMGGEISEGTNIKLEYKGRVYSFCCAGCPDIFKSDPEKYSKIADDEVASNKQN